MFSSRPHHFAKRLIISTLCSLIATIALLNLPISKATVANAQDSAIAQHMASFQQARRRWIQIDLSRQRLIAWEGDRQAYAVVVSTGTMLTPTPTGVFSIQSMHHTARMRGETYDVPNVPFTMYYHGSYAIHGAYWHQQFGTPVSHGCINVALDHAEWLFNWTDIGTPVVVHN